MGCIEQMLYGGGLVVNARQVLGRTPGVTPDIAAETVRRVEEWGLDHAGDIGTPALLCWPLAAAGAAAAPDGLFAVLRVACGGARVTCHALVLSGADYGAYGFNPFRVEKEGLFLESWAPGLMIERREWQPSSLAPLVARLPDAQDAELIDEALRQYFERGRLIMPLARAEAASDRFWALFLASLPMVHKRRLTFASFAPRDGSDYTLAAIARPGASYRTWCNGLTASVGRPLPAQLETYLRDVRRCLAGGDLMGVERLSRALEGVGGSAGRRPAERPQAIAATITTSAEPVESDALWRRAREPSGAGYEEEIIAANRPAGASGGASAAMSRPAARRGGAGRSEPASGRRRLGLGAGLAIALAVLAGAAWQWHARRPVGTGVPAPAASLRAARQAPTPGAAIETLAETRAEPGAAAAEGVPDIRRQPSPEAANESDIGAIYAGELDAYARAVAAAGGAAKARHQAAERALAALQMRGGEQLGREARVYCAAVAQGIGAPAQPDREAAAAQRQAAQGLLLARELRRLTLAGVALRSDDPWRDLGGLDARALQARWDSLAQRAPAALAAAQRGFGLSGLLAEVESAARAAGARAALAGLLARPHRDESWVAALETAAMDVGHGDLPRADLIYRDAAFALVRLKRAEQMARFTEAAYRTRYVEEDWFPPVVREALTDLRRDLASGDIALAPPLALAHVQLHDDLAALRARIAAAPEVQALGEAFAALDRNPAAAFDPEVYGPHVARSGLAAAAALLVQGRRPEAVPLRFFPGGDRRGALLLLDRLGAGAQPGHWREIATAAQDPFLKAWAMRLAGAAEGTTVAGGSPAAAGTPLAPPAEPPPADLFQEEFLAIARATEALNAQAQRGQDWSESFLALRLRLEEFRGRHRVQPSTTPKRREQLARLDHLAQALAAPLPLRLEWISITVASDLMTGAGEVYLDLLDAKGELLLRTPAVALGRTGGEGEAWRGERALRAELAVSPAQPLRAVVRRVADSHVLGEAVYDDTPAGMAPGALGRARAATAGAASGGAEPITVSFRLADWVWHRLTLPDPRQPPRLSAVTSAAQ